MIASSRGLDDFDWGVDLFAQEPLQFKKLIYEMRYDEVSAVDAGFGPFIIGLRINADRILDAEAWDAEEEASAQEAGEES